MIPPLHVVMLCFHPVGYELAVVNGGRDYQGGGGVLEHPMTLPVADSNCSTMLMMRCVACVVSCAPSIYFIKFYFMES